MFRISDSNLIRILVLISLGLGAFCFAISVGAQSVDDHIGALTCAGCHADAYDKWQIGAHAASEKLLKGAYREDRSCLQCHSPASASGMSNVQCETCHGGGRHYFADYVMRDAELARLVGLRDPDRSTCMSCHDSNSARLVPFDYEKAREAIRHW